RLPQAAYRPEVSAKVYQEMVWLARLILAEGGSAVADAVFVKPVNRRKHRWRPSGSKRSRPSSRRAVCRLIGDGLKDCLLNAPHDLVGEPCGALRG
ncbi:hypothetical protein ACCT11_35645, partial [Rhizobium johnstonii]|uniref:hypothetical protein n=1 Tax=Rhizobium johnstonii TaxID=3019933 RepID=UPI003F949598